MPADLAFGAYQRGNFLYALMEAERRIDANSKDAAAMTLIGEIYRDGAAVPRDSHAAADWFRLASNLGDPQAAYELGAIMIQGADGVPTDPAGAEIQFERAAAKDNHGALYNLGVLALEGVGGKAPDYAKAAQYFLRAANAGDDDAAYSYGVMLRDGKGVPMNIAEAVRWLKRAADDGVIAGQVEYAIMLFNGEGVPKDEAGRPRSFSSPPPGAIHRPEPRGSSLRAGRSAAERPGQGRRLEQLRQGGGAQGQRPRCADRQPDTRRAEPLHQDDPRDRRLLTPRSPLRGSRKVPTCWPTPVASAPTRNQPRFLAVAVPAKRLIRWWAHKGSNLGPAD